VYNGKDGIEKSPMQQVDAFKQMEAATENYRKLFEKRTPEIEEY